MPRWKPTERAKKQALINERNKNLNQYGRAVCQQKTERGNVYDNEQIAIVASKNRDFNAYAYNCRFCGKWHIAGVKRITPEEKLLRDIFGER